LKVSVNEASTEVSVETDQPDDNRGRSYTVEYEIRLPASFDALITNINGNVTILDVNGRSKAETVNGNISAVMGEVPQDDIDLSTVNGNISLTVPSTISATFSASVVNGTIGISGLELSNIVTTPTSTTGVIGNGDRSINLRTVNGNINASGRN
jgi:DUF4097 and DUF4098 domain-containing protein YvlB